MINNPCKQDCPRRSAECHSKCQDYANFKIELEKEHDIIRKEKMKSDEYNSFRNDMIEKNRKNRHTSNQLRTRGY